MSSIQTLHDTLIALVVTVGVAVFLSIVMIAIGGLFQHRKNRHQASPHPASPAQHVTHDEDSRQLILR